jgi:Prion-inhibition and propagation
MDPLAQLNVVAVFNRCLEVIRFIQKGRNFGEEYERRLVLFENAKNRLLNWGDRVDINRLLQPNFGYDVRNVFDTLRQLEQLFLKAQKCLEKYQIPVETSQVQVTEEFALASAHRQSFGSLFSNGGIFDEWNKNRKEQAQQREKQTNMFQKGKFVVEDADTLDKLFEHVINFLDMLEKEEWHRRVISADHIDHDGQGRYPSYGGQVYLPPEELSADDARCRRVSAGSDWQYALRSGSISTQSVSSGRQLRDSFNSRFPSVSDASSFSEPLRRLSEPIPVEDTCRVWRELEFDEKGEQTDLSPTSRQLSHLELDVSAQVDTTSSVITVTPSLDKARRRDSVPTVKQQQKSATWAPSPASASLGTNEGFSSRSLKPNLGGRGCKCLASALDRSQLAILTSSEVYLFDTSQSPLPAKQLEALGRHPLERGTWTGVAIAGSYLAAWGDRVVRFKSAHQKVLASN